MLYNKIREFAGIVPIKARPLGRICKRNAFDNGRKDLMASMDGYVEITFKCTDSKSKALLSDYIQKELNEAKSRSGYDESYIDEYSWLTESYWEPGDLSIDCDLVDAYSGDTVQEFLQGVIDAGIDAEFTADVSIFDLMHGESVCEERFDSKTMRNA